MKSGWSSLAVFGFAVGIAPLGYSLYSSDSPVKLVDREGLEKLLNKPRLTLVEFFADWCGHCRTFAPEYERAARALKGFVNVVAVSDGSVAAEHGVRGFPTITLYLGDGSSNPKKKPFKSERKAKALVDFVLGSLSKVVKRRLGGSEKNKNGNFESSKSKDKKDKDKKHHKKSKKDGTCLMLDEDSLGQLESRAKDTRLIYFYAPWCGVCTQFTPTWEQFCSTVKGVVCAKIDASANTKAARNYQIRGYPTVKLLPAGVSNASRALEYSGSRTEADLLEFVAPYAGGQKEPEQLLSHAQFEEHCSKGVCVILFIPHIEDSSPKDRLRHIKTFSEAVTRAAGAPLQSFWCSAGDHTTVEEKLRLEFGFPAAVAIRQDKGMFATFRGAFQTDALYKFLVELIAGSARVSEIPEGLEFGHVEEAWTHSEILGKDEL